MHTALLPLKQAVANYTNLRTAQFRSLRQIQGLIDRYLTAAILSAHLIDLSSQFQQPHQRPWGAITWKAIQPSQIQGIAPELFLMVLASAVEVEAPIRGYAQESWLYLRAIHPEAARFMGGTYAEDGSVETVGVWEKEERQHSPALRKIYQQLTGTPLPVLKPNTVHPYRPTVDPWLDAYRHILGRVNTEWSAVSTYLWLMAHASGALRQALAQLLQDEVNHLAKFWGFRRWAFRDNAWDQLKFSARGVLRLFHHHQAERSQGAFLQAQFHPFRDWPHGLELLLCFTSTFRRLWQWDQHLTPDRLDQLLGQPPLPRCHCQQIINQVLMTAL